MTAETHPIDKELVMAYLDGELKPEQAANIAIHLDQCAECRELAAELRGISSQLLTWSVDPAPGRLSDAVTGALRQFEGQIRSGSPFQKQSRRLSWRDVLTRRWTWAAGGIAAAIVFLVILVSQVRFSKPAAQMASRELSSQAMSNYLAADKLENENISENLNATPPPDQIENQTSKGPMIARTASLNMSVKDFNAARTSVDRIVRGHQGYVSSLNLSTEKGAPQTLSAKVMIPAAQMDAALVDLKGLGRVEQEQQGGEEVTSQVVDLDARLKNSRETETQLMDILRSRTGKVADVLEVEKEMARVRGEIETMQAEQKQLRERVDFGSIGLNLSEEYQAQIGSGPWMAGRQIRNALVDGYHAAVDGLVSVCVFLLTVGPSLFLWGLILFLPARWAWRRWQKSRAQSEARA